MSDDNKVLTEEERQAAAVAAGQAHRDSFEQGVTQGDPISRDEPVVHEKPEHVPEKFFNKDTGEVNYEAWNKAHTDLESKFHQGSDKDAAADDKDSSADDKPASDGDTPEAKAILETPAAQQAAENYAQNGELTDADYTALEAQGISKDMVNSYIAGQEAQANVLTDAAFGETGGAEGYGEMIDWAAENLEPAQVSAFNAQVQSGDPEVIKVAVKGMYAQYSENATIEGGRTGGSAPSTNSSTFESKREMTAAINAIEEGGTRRRYDVDPAYRQEVQRKIGNSRRAGKVF